MKVVVAGEVDSGKSTLIGRFLFEMGSAPKEAVSQISEGLSNDFEFAYLSDSLEEERKGNLTIDTTQIFCRNKKGSGFLFIDVPGHRELLRNALCGSSYARVAILVIDILKSIQEGTKRHADILKFLGIEKIIAVINKADLANFSQAAFEAVQSETAAFFDSLSIPCQCIIPVSASRGDNLVKKSKEMSWYKGRTLLEALSSLGDNLKEGARRDFYFPIQDIYKIDKRSFFVGPVLSGSVKSGQVVGVSPADKIAKVKSIRVFNRAVSRARQAESAGLELDRIDGISRGQVLYGRVPPETVTEINAKIYCLRPLKADDGFIFRCLSQQTEARIQKITGVLNTAAAGSKQQDNSLQEGDVAEAVVATQNPVAIKKYRDLNSLGRFVLNSDREICAVGVIV